MKKRSTNYELLRIILTLFIPIYHWLLYNGLFYADNFPNTVYSLFAFSGIPFSCLYAFLAMSNFFLIKKGNRWNFEKLLSFLAQVLTLLFLKNVIIYALFPQYYFTDYYQLFFVNGAWWYVWAYIVIMLFYPVLNYFIFNAPKVILYATTLILAIIFVINYNINNTIFLNDCATFLFIYLFMGCLERHDIRSKFYLKHRKTILVAVYIICTTVLSVLSVYLKHPSNTLDLTLENALLQNLHCRYNVYGLISGIVLFVLFKDIKIPYKPLIHRISGITFYVFLLHETVMCVFWYFGIKSKELLAPLPSYQFFGWILFYLICCIIVAFITSLLYSKLLAPIWNKLITHICNIPVVKNIENTYQERMRVKNKTS